MYGNQVILQKIMTHAPSGSVWRLLPVLSLIIFSKSANIRTNSVSNSSNVLECMLGAPVFYARAVSYSQEVRNCSYKYFFLHFLTDITITNVQLLLRSLLS